MVNDIKCLNLERSSLSSGEGQN